MPKDFSEITPYIRSLAALSTDRNHITPEMYGEHKVFRGLRDVNGNGVITGLTEISTIRAKETLPDGTRRPCAGKLYYRGIDVEQLCEGFLRDDRFGF